MKKLLSSLLLLGFITSTFASGIIKSRAANATEVFVPLGKDSRISLADLALITPQDFEKVTGKHLSFIGRISFRAGQKKLRNSINTDGTINSKKLLKFVNEGDPSKGFHVGGFALGFFLGLIGVLIAYVIGGDESIKRNRTKWAWIGCAIIVVLSLILLVAAVNSIT